MTGAEVSQVSVHVYTARANGRPLRTALTFQPIPEARPYARLSLPAGTRLRHAPGSRRLVLAVPIGPGHYEFLDPVAACRAAAGGRLGLAYVPGHAPGGPPAEIQEA